MRVEWKAEDAAGNSVTIAVFLSTNENTVFSGAPVLTTPPGDSALLSNLASDQDYFLGMALDEGGGVFTPSGPLLRAHTGAPVFVDAAASGAGADGTTPALAFTSPLAGVLTAFANGGGNVWIAGGNYIDVALPVAAGVNVYGGFGPGFNLDLRDPATFPTVLNGRAGLAILDVQGGDPGSILDGLQLDGGGVASFGVEVSDTPIEVRSVQAFDCSGRGFKLRSLLLDRALPATFVGCASIAHGGDGLSLAGAFDLVLDGCSFDSNVQEGVDLDDLLAPETVPVSLVARNCRFFGNGKEGLDVDLIAPPFPGPNGSSFRVDVENCAFELNGADGLLIDIDYELAPGWTADLRVLGCMSRANAGAGVHLDIDAQSTTLVHRLSTTANAGDGLLVTSETAPGTATVSASALMGNMGAGMRASIGNVVLLASHCIVAGNALGGVVSEVLESSSVSSIAYLQAQPWVGTRPHFCVDVTDPASSPFNNVSASEYLRVSGFDGQNLTLAGLGSLMGGEVVEISDDGTERTLILGAGTTATVQPTPQTLRVPALLTVLLPGHPAAEDYSILPGSTADGAGMTSPGGPSVDAGVFGAPFGGDVGRVDPVPAQPFFASGTLPVVGTSLGAFDRVEVVWSGGSPGPASVTPSTVRAIGAGGAVLPISFGVSNGNLFFDPPAGGWPLGDFTMELHAGIQSVQGENVTAPLAIPWSRP